MKRLAIIGSGDLAVLIAHHAKLEGYKIAGAFDDYKVKNEIVNGMKILGKLSEVEALYNSKEFDELMIGIGYNHIQFRKKIFNDFFLKIPFSKIISRGAYIDPSCSIGEGCLVLPGSVLDMNVKLNNNVLLNTGVTIAHDTEIGAHNFVAPAVSFAGFIKTGQCCTFGIGSIIIDNINIADNVRTGGGTLVVKSIDQEGLYIGQPAKYLRENK